MSINIHLSFVSSLHGKLRHDVTLIQTGTDDTHFIMNSCDKKSAYFEVLERYLKEMKPPNDCSKWQRKEYGETKGWYKLHMQNIEKAFDEFKQLIDLKLVYVEWYMI